MAKIMLVDDSKLVRKKLTDILTKAGHNIVCECERGDDALTCYRTYKPDIVTMDINMPGMNGIDATEAIRKVYPDAKIIIVSANNQEKMILDGIIKGASCFIVKPFSDDHVIRTVNRLAVDIMKQEQAKKDLPSPKDLNFDEKISGLILIIDDSKLVLKITSDILQKDGHNIITSQTGKEGLELARTGNPDLIILDIVMPDMDGYDVLKELKKDEFTKNIPVIMYSSKTRKEDILLAMKLGVADYISKNCDEHILSGKSRSSIADARKKRMMMAKNDVNNIIVDRQDNITYITFRFTLKSENAMNERKKIFTGAFLRTLADTVVIFDYRLINEMDEGEVSQLKYLFSLFPEREMLIVCGKHYAAFATDFDMDGKNKFFISMGDAELYVESRNKTAKS
ncbi:MAG TPA: response regulator [Spirochaetota bacterium]|nr:response regulator [Spirochaetota bacterium]